MITALVEAGAFSLNDALLLTLEQLMYFYEQKLRNTAAERAATVIDMLAAISALSNTEHVQQHLQALQSIALPAPSGDTPDSYTKDSNTETVYI